MLKMSADRDIPTTTHEAPAPDAMDALESLKSVREGRGLSLQDIFNTTRISLVNLAALEDEDFARLPPPIYTKDFISKYSRTVGIDEKPLLIRYDRYMTTLNRPAEPIEIKNHWPENRMRYWFLYGSLALVVAVGIIVLATFLNHGNRPAASPTVTAPPLPPPPVETATAKAGTPTAVQNGPAPSALPPTTAAAKPAPARPPATVAAVVPISAANAVPPADTDKQYKYHLLIRATETTWMRIVEDKMNSREVLLKPGEQIERRAMEGFRLEIGNAGGIELIFQQKHLGPLGRHGEVIVVSLPRENP